MRSQEYTLPEQPSEDFFVNEEEEFLEGDCKNYIIEELRGINSSPGGESEANVGLDTLDGNMIKFESW